MRFRRWLAVATAGVLLGAMPLRAAAPWEIIEVQGRHYLTLTQIGQFYGFRSPPEVNPAYAMLLSPTRSLIFSMQSQEVIINGVRHWLSFPVREVNGRVLVSRVDLSKTLEPILRPTRIKAAQAFRTVVIDAGHGGSDTGARSAYSLDEKHLALDVAWRLKLLLDARGYRTVMTRSRDEFIPLETRARIADTTGDSIFISIHFNHGDRPAVGVETYCLSPRGAPSTNRGHPSLTDYVPTAGEFTDAPSLLLAHCVQGRMGQLRRTDFERRGVKRARFVVLKETTRPSILVEGGFVSSPEDARLINDPQHRQMLARQICQGVTDYRSLILTGRTPDALPLPVPREAPPVLGTTNITAASALSLTRAVTNTPGPVLALVNDWQQGRSSTNAPPGATNGAGPAAGAAGP